MAANTKSRTYRLPVDLWERICALREQREAEVREQVPEYLRDSVRVQEVDVVKELLQRGLEMVDAEQQRPRGKRK
ncbi:hypothetical protein [Vulgatibacter sp.]|uniref:hypothetical protein n=1 Tax=Vulgatibacter sp. TaxID=1971226 RepID=UPI003569AFF7